MSVTMDLPIVCVANVSLILDLTSDNCCRAIAGNYTGHIIPDTLYTVTENTG